MNVKIGVADSTKVVELDIDSLDELKAELQALATEGGIAWFTDTKGREVGIPAGKVAFVEVEVEEGGPAVGFAPAV